MSMITKYKLNELAKDLNVSNQDVIEVLSAQFEGVKKPMTTLLQEETNYVIEHFSQKNQVASFDAYFAAKAKPVVKENKTEAPAQKAAEQPKPAAAAKPTPVAAKPAPVAAQPAQTKPQPAAARPAAAQPASPFINKNTNSKFQRPAQPAQTKQPPKPQQQSASKPHGVKQQLKTAAPTGSNVSSTTETARTTADTRGS